MIYYKYALMHNEYHYLWTYISYSLDGSPLLSLHYWNSVGAKIYEAGLGDRHYAEFSHLLHGPIKEWRQ